MSADGYLLSTAEFAALQAVESDLVFGPFLLPAAQRALGARVSALVHAAIGRPYSNTDFAPTAGGELDIDLTDRREASTPEPLPYSSQAMTLDETAREPYP